MRIAYFVESVPITRAVIDGTASLGGSESACLGVARAMARRGHEVHLFAMRLEEGCTGADAHGVTWHHGEDVFAVSAVVHWDVFCSLRMPQVFERHIRARLRILWNQDMLVGDGPKNYVMAVSWNIDRIAYVSHYHRAQWEGKLPDLHALGMVVKNGYDPSLVPTDAVKDWKRVIHISRPERGLAPLLDMWPALKARIPDAELRVCRYQSMYDGEGSNVRASCEAFDRVTAEVNAKVGGITVLGALGKADLYREIAEAAVMWYPGVAGFAETSCIAAIEAQANGTPFVGSWKGALPETVPSGLLIKGDAMTPEYQAESVAAVEMLMRACQDRRRIYRDKQSQGRQHVEAYTHDAVAADWEAQILDTFKGRFERDTMGVLRSFLHEDDHTAAKQLALDMRAAATDQDRIAILDETLAFCDRVIAGQDQDAETYGAHALPDPLVEWDHQPRFHQSADILKGVTNLLDVACGNGSFAIGFAKTYPEARVVGLDYSDANIERAKKGAEQAGVADRCTFYCRPVWDMDAQAQIAIDDVVAQHGPFDGLFCGEFLEHVANAPGLIDGLERYVAPGAAVLYTVPNGPFVELMEPFVQVFKGHVHHFEHDDVIEVFGQKDGLAAQFCSAGRTARGHGVGHWLIRYAAHGGGAARPRNYAHRILTQRPKPKLTVGLITKDAGLDLARCLASIWPVADEIIVGDTGSSDDTKKIAARWGARVLDLPDVYDDPDGFAGARNKVLAAAAGDWFMWIDADETLLHPEQLWQYLEGSSAFNGYQLHQTHLMIDQAPTFDRPVRIFRKRPDIQFHGCVHEQPQQGDCNGDIWPVLDLVQPVIAHTGYLTEETRRFKMIARNRGLLERDQERFPERMLGKALWVREYSQMALMCEERGQEGQAQWCYAQAIGLYEKYLNDPGHKLHGLVRAFYESALSRVAGAMEFDLGIAGKIGALPKDARAKNQRVWVRSLDDLKRLVQHKLAQIEKQHQPDVPDVEPVVVADGNSMPSATMNA